MLALLGVGGLGFYSAYGEAQQIYDTELSHTADLMLTILIGEDEEDAKESSATGAPAPVNPDVIELGRDFDGQPHPRHHSDLAFRIWKKGSLVFFSKKAKDFGPERRISGFSDEMIGEKRWRFFVLYDERSNYRLEVAERSTARTKLIRNTLSTIFSPLAILPPIILILVWIGLRKGLKPLEMVSEAVKSRSASDLTPLSPHHTVDEIEPLTIAINELLAGLENTLKKERRFTDFAAHELRTPIAIFKTLAQTAIKSTDDAERRFILEAQVKAADRATGLVDKLLALARLEHTDVPIEVINPADIVEVVVEERRPLAGERQINLVFRKGDKSAINSNKELIGIILSNLIDNAIKYTHPGGRVQVTVDSNDNMATISVRDDGPGIAEAHLSLVMERFFRVAGQDQPGAGLGLSICTRAAELLGARLILRNNEQTSGLEAIIEFPMIRKNFP